MGTRANWFVEETEEAAEGADPFASAKPAPLPGDIQVHAPLDVTPKQDAEEIHVDDLTPDILENSTSLAGAAVAALRRREAMAYGPNSSVPELEAYLKKLLDEEAECFAAGVTCPLKEKADMSCVFCPVHHRGTDDPMDKLCSVGKEQERVLALLVAKRHGGQDG